MQNLQVKIKLRNPQLRQHILQNNRATLLIIKNQGIETKSVDNFYLDSRLNAIISVWSSITLKGTVCFQGSK